MAIYDLQMTSWWLIFNDEMIKDWWWSSNWKLNKKKRFQNVQKKNSLMLSDFSIPNLTQKLIGMNWKLLLKLLAKLLRYDVIIYFGDKFWWHFYFLGLGSWRIDAWWWQEQRLGYWLWWIYQYDEVCSSFSIRRSLIGRQIRCQCGREFHPSWISVWSGWNRLDPIPNLETFNC